MGFRLMGGVPKESDYLDVLMLDDFGRLENFSNKFLSTNRKSLRGFSRKWVSDSLHQWSRQWEYPYVFSRVQPVIDGKEKKNILDAGSGLTFFPYYIKSELESVDVYCCDYDKRLEACFNKINEENNVEVSFSQADLRALPYEDNFFDVIYCISVLEHTNDYEEIIDEFYRTIKDGGTLILTFDISLDGARDISPELGNKLLDAVTAKFDDDEHVAYDLKSQISIPNVFTTLDAEKLDTNLLPWNYPAFLYRIKSLVSGKGWGHWPPMLTVYCITLTKRCA